ncbi:MAG: DUF58 domain-containing protein [Legionella sp.]|nr:MAG: DUF58 domain-containing protein [Legionella sp.]
MNGLSVSTAELIALASQAQRVCYSPDGFALRPGQHQSKLRGRGMDFSEARNYQAGDDIRHMEWRMTARTGRPHVKVYQEERERPVFVLVDFNPSMYFGTRIAFKSVVAARLAAVLAWTAVKQGDRVGGLIYSAHAHKEFPPRSRQAGILPFLAGLSQYSQQTGLQEAGNTQSLYQALLRMQYVIKPGSIVVLISDFYQMDEQCEQLLKRLHVHNDILAYHVCDPLELAPPLPQVYGMTDGKTDVIVDTSIDTIRFGYQFYCEQRMTALRQQLKRMHMQYVQITAQSNLALLVKQTFPRLRS